MDITELLNPENLPLIIFAIIAVVVAFFLIKRLAGCIIRLIVVAILLAVLGYIYFNYLEVKEESPGTEQPAPSAQPISNPNATNNP